MGGALGKSKSSTYTQHVQNACDAIQNLLKPVSPCYLLRQRTTQSIDVLPPTGCLGVLWYTIVTAQSKRRLQRLTIAGCGAIYSIHLPRAFIRASASGLNVGFAGNWMLTVVYCSLGIGNVLFSVFVCST